MAKNKIDRERLEYFANNFSLSDVIEILSEYSVIHSDLPQIDVRVEARGLQDGTKGKIYIDNTFAYHARRNTVIHELYHVHDLAYHLHLGETKVRMVADIIDEKLFSARLMVPETLVDTDKPRLEKIAEGYDLRDIIDTLVDNSVVHIPLPTEDPAEVRCGLFDYLHRTIYINNLLAYHERRNAVLHEAVHVHNDDHHLGLTHKQIQNVADIIDKKLFKRPE